MSAPTPPAAPCAWPLNTSAVPGWDDAEPEQQGLAAAIASFVLWALSGRRFGLCTRTVRPCPPARPDVALVRAPTTGGAYSGLTGSLWPGPCGHTAPGCGCARGRGYTLPGPVNAVTEVVIDGAVLDPGEWRADGDTIIRVAAPWPMAQDLTLEATEPGTWAVTYVRGIPVSDAGQYATGILAGEVLKAIRGNAGCKLPPRAQSVSRQGVDVQLIDPDTFLQGGRTGIPAVDLWLVAVNPRRIASPPQVWSPDLPGVHS